MNINLKFLLIGTSLSLFPNLLYAQCAETDCLKLGYDSLKSCTNGLKCPFGNYWACLEAEPKATLGECTGYAKNCTIGQILNSDGTCSNDKVSGKTPIGVVVYISGGSDKCGYAMTTSPIQTNIAWGGYGTDIPSLPNYTSHATATRDFDVSGNMTKIIQAGDASTYPAAYAALNYAPSSAPASKGKWMLPTAGILNSLYTNLNAINNAISKVGGTQLTDDNEHIWSSSEYGSDRAWVFCTGGSGGVGRDGKSNGHVVRPVLAF